MKMRTRCPPASGDAGGKLAGIDHIGAVAATEDEFVLRAGPAADHVDPGVVGGGQDLRPVPQHGAARDLPSACRAATLEPVEVTAADCLVAQRAVGVAALVERAKA